MGRNSGGVVEWGTGGDIEWGQSEPLINIKDKKTYNEIFRGISRFHAVLGIRERSVRMAPMDGAFGVTFVGGPGGTSTGILLNKKVFDQPLAKVKKEYQKQYEHGMKAKTNAPVQHTVTHELAHATWNARMSSTKARAAGKEIKAVFNQWKKDRGNSKGNWGKYVKKQWGGYAATNVSEFWSEGVTKAVHGRTDKYSSKLIKIAKKYQL